MASREEEEQVHSAELRALNADALDELRRLPDAGRRTEARVGGMRLEVRMGSVVEMAARGCSLALCALGTGFYGFPRVAAAAVAVEAAVAFAAAPRSLHTVVFSVWDERQAEVYERVLARAVPG